MRPAPPSGTPSESDSLDENDLTPLSAGSRRNERQSRSRQWWAARIGAGVVLLVLIAVGGLALLGGGGAPGPAGPPPATSPPAPPRTEFVFPLVKTGAVATGRRNNTAARTAATRIQTALSRFYDAAFMDPETWKNGLAAEAWDAFAEPLREQAMSDAASLTLGDAESSVDQLSVTEASLSVRLLLDPRGRPRAAVATVVFDASGTLSGGEAVLVSNRASFLLEPEGSRWLVVGYPTARTEVNTPSPSPSPGASGSPTPTGSPSPSPGGSP
jgi:hypothetical protein